VVVHGFVHVPGLGSTVEITRSSARFRRIAAISSSTTESSARRVFPCSTPVSAITARMASKIRFGRSERASRRRY
jgi:hypothetical protein